MIKNLEIKKGQPRIQALKTVRKEVQLNIMGYYPNLKHLPNLSLNWLFPSWGLPPLYRWGLRPHTPLRRGCGHPEGVKQNIMGH